MWSNCDVNQYVCVQASVVETSLYAVLCMLVLHCACELLQWWAKGSWKGLCWYSVVNLNQLQRTELKRALLVAVLRCTSAHYCINWGDVGRAYQVTNLHEGKWINMHETNNAWVVWTNIFLPCMLACTTGQVQIAWKHHLIQSWSQVMPESYEVWKGALLLGIWSNPGCAGLPPSGSPVDCSHPSVLVSPDCSAARHTELGACRSSP